MFMGHYGPAVWDSQRGKTKPIIALWQGFLAVQAVDIVFALLAILGVEGTIIQNDQPFFNIPWSHSLLTAILISLMTGLIFYRAKPILGKKGFWIIVMLAFSHWVLDLIVHRPDLPLYPSSSLVFGFGFWNYPLAAYAMEMGLLAAGLLYWVRVTRAQSVFYSLAPWGLFIFMGVIQYIFITQPGLDLQAGQFDLESQMQGAALGVSALLTFILLALMIGVIERGRPSKFI